MYGYGYRGWLSPWQRLREMERQMNRLFGEPAGRRAAAFPPVNVYADADAAAVTAELPGVDPEDLDISLQGRTLVIRGERKAPATGDNDAWLRQERTFGKFARSVDLPFAVDAEKVEASYRDGVLEVTLHRSDADKPKKVNVQS